MDSNESIERSLSQESSNDLLLDKAEKDKEKFKYKLTKEKIDKYSFAQPTFRNRLEKQVNQYVKLGESFQTNNQNHKQLYGYINCEDALHL